MFSQLDELIHSLTPKKVRLLADAVANPKLQGGVETHNYISQ